MNIKTIGLAGFLLSILMCCLFFAARAGAEEMLLNGSFESYNAATLVPDNWQVIDGNVQIYTEHSYDGNVSVYSLGGTMENDTNTPNPPQRGSLVQLIDLSTHPDWDRVNWFKVTLNMAYRVWGAKGVDVYLEYLPASYNTMTIAPDDAAWNGPDVQRVWSYFGPKSHARPDKPWYIAVKSNVEIPRVRWARLRFMFNAEYKSNRYFEDGPYYVAIDAVSLDLEAITPEEPCTDNLLINPGFESVSGDMPLNWNLLSGSMIAIGFGSKAPYAGSHFAGNIGGTVTPNPDTGGDPIDNPNHPQHGSLVQVIDLSSLENWGESNFILIDFSGYYLSNGINALSATVEYLPESYNEISVNWDDAAWNSDARTVVNLALGGTSGVWKKFETNKASIPKVRWIRVRLNVDDSSRQDGYLQGEYLGGFDQVCLHAVPFVAEPLIKNPSFEEETEDHHPAYWHEDPSVGSVNLMAVPPFIPFGSRWLSKLANGDDTVGRVYQVIDLADKIPGWLSIDPNSGQEEEFRFIKFTLSAWITNVGGKVSVGLEYLPYSYNTRENITWNDPAWQHRHWVSDGNTFTNQGGDAIDLGNLIEDINGSSPQWRKKTYTGWLPRVRWLRLRIDLDVTPTYNSYPSVGIDALNLSCECRQYGPYSGFGYLPEATFPEDPDAPDKPVPGWVGEEGDGISGGYTGKTKRNYVNPAFAGFADGVADYSPSGQHIYNTIFTDPNSILGRPYNDANWYYQIVTLGDMDLSMLADYFGPNPSGEYHPGEITVTFDKCPIVNGEGPDFAVFENGFVLGWTTAEIFGELAYVEVSSNGIDFIRFPSHSLTPYWPGSYGCFIPQGVFGLVGKHVNAYGDQWGTPFDLEWLADHPLVLNGSVDLNNIRYVRIIDIPGGGPADANGQYTSLFLDSYGNPIFDAWVTWGSGGVDLDAVGVINTSAQDSDGDHIVDYWDNCKKTANKEQYDTDGDGYGNMCDCDIDGDDGGNGIVDIADYTVFRAAYGSHGPKRIPGEPGQPDTYIDASENWNPDADFNGDNVVNAADFAIFRSRYGSMAPFE